MVTGTGATSPGGGRGGFTLIEALIALTIGTFVVLMASGVFVAQSDFYDFVVRQSRVQDDARSVVQSMRRILPTIPRGGFVAASADRMVVRRPQSIAVVCSLPNPSTAHALITSGAAALDVSAAAGIARYTPAIGGTPASWSFHDTNVTSVVSGLGGTAADACFLAGADTLGVRGDFVTLGNLAALTGVNPAPGDVFMIFEEFELEFATSTLNGRQTALFQGIAGETLVEFASGLSSDARFEYRVGGTTWQASVSGAGLENIDAVRVDADSEVAGTAASGSDARFDLSVVIPVGGGT